MSQSLACPHCGKNYVISERYSGASVKCKFCGELFRVPEEELIPDAVFIDEPGQATPRFNSGRGSQQAAGSATVNYARSDVRYGVEPSRLVGAFLAALLGTLGIHHFYTGQARKGMLCLILPFFTCGLSLPVHLILGLFDGIRYFAMSDQEWSHRWQNYAL